MQIFTISEREEGQRLLAYLHKLLPRAGGGLLHKSMRKKNIMLNAKRCDGRERLCAGDIVQIWFSLDTMQTLGVASRKRSLSMLPKEFSRWIIYEDEHILLLNKPVGLLTQGNKTGEASLDNYVKIYVGAERGMKPSVCNRLDRNTTGIVTAGKTVRGLQVLNDLLRNRSLNKVYDAVVCGETEDEGMISGFLRKERATNTVRTAGEGVTAVTQYRTIRSFQKEGCLLSLVEAVLLTGRSHQIRVHFASLGHPLLGDDKYGTEESRSVSCRLGIKGQMLHARQITFPCISGELSYLSEKTFVALPSWSFGRQTD